MLAQGRGRWVVCQKRIRDFSFKIRLRPYLFPPSSPYLHCGTNSSALYNLSAAGVKKEEGGGFPFRFFSPPPLPSPFCALETAQTLYNWNSPVDHRWREILFQNHNKILESDWLLLKHCFLKNSTKSVALMSRCLISATPLIPKYLARPFKQESRLVPSIRQKKDFKGYNQVRDLVQTIKKLSRNGESLHVKETTAPCISRSLC